MEKESATRTRRAPRIRASLNEATPRLAGREEAGLSSIRNAADALPDCDTESQVAFSPPVGAGDPEDDCAEKTARGTSTPDQSVLGDSMLELLQNPFFIAEDKRAARNAAQRRRYAVKKQLNNTPVRRARTDRIARVQERRRATSTPSRVATAARARETQRSRVGKLSTPETWQTAESERLRSAARRLLESSPEQEQRQAKRISRSRAVDPFRLAIENEPSPTIGMWTPAVAEAVKKFHQAMAKIEAVACPVCMEKFPGTDHVKSSGLCRRCHSDKHVPRKFSAENGMDPGLHVPDVLSRLTPIEEMLISQVACIMSVHRLPGGQLGYAGNVINFAQDVAAFATDLPRLPRDVEVILVKRGSATRSSLYRVRRSLVENALIWLRLNNPYYRDIRILRENLDVLPEDGFIDGDLRTIVDDSVPADPCDMGPVNEVQAETLGDENMGPQGFVPQARSRLTEEEAVQALVQESVQSASNAVNWPTLEKEPVNEFTSEGYDARAFPCLFPWGKGSLRTPRMVTVTPAEYGLHLMRYMNRRFRAHPRFRFFVFNSQQRWRATTQGSLFLNYRTPEDKNLSAAEFRAKYVENSADLCRRILHFGSSLRGTPQFWINERTNLIGMVNQHGCPTTFFTLSSADLHWPDFHRWFPGGIPSDLLTAAEQYKVRHQNLVDDPDTASWLFYKRAELFIKNVLSVLFDVKDFWFRFEWQARGSPHVHGFLWIRGAPSVEGVEKKTPEERQIIADWFGKFLITWNEALDNPVPEVHPCRVPFSEITDIDDHYHNLVNMIQRHTRCSIGYCLRKKIVDGRYLCRFEFPKDLREDNALVLKPNKRYRLETRRNDPQLNSHNKPMMVAWAANVDATALVDATEAVQYAIKYAAKKEPRAKSLAQLCEQSVGDLKDADNPRTIAGKLLIKSVGERDYTAQEVCHHLHGLPLVRCSRTFIKIFLFPDSNLRRIRKQASGIVSGDNDATENDNVRKYVSRQEELDGKAMRQMLTEYSWNAKQKVWVKKRDANNNVLIVVPSLPEDAASEAYCRQRMMLDVPFRSTSELLAGCDGSWVDAFALSMLPPLQGHCGNCEDDSENEYEAPPPQEPERLGWMVASAAGPNWECQHLYDSDLGKRPLDLEFQWDESWVLLPAAVARTVKDFVSRSKISTGAPVAHEDEVDTSLLNSDQHAVFDLVQRYRSDPNKEKEPLRLIIQGSAGTGKSFLIKALMSMLNATREVGNDSLTAALVAPTGVAANLVGGFTIQSHLIIPPKSNEMKPMKGKAARNFQRKFANTQYLLVEERSMVGCRLFCAMDARLRQAFPSRSDVPFGGVSMILIGDHFQLPPVRDHELYSATNCHWGVEARQNAYRLYMLFNRGIVLSIQQRQIGTDPTVVRFREFLSRLKYGQSTPEDWAWLMERQIHLLSEQEQARFKNAVHLYANNKAAAAFNEKVLRDRGYPVALIEAVHVGPGAASSDADETRGLEPVLYLSVGCRVMLKLNLWTAQGLVNGATGEVQDIYYGEGSRPPALPIAVLVKFDRFSGPCLDGKSGCVPIEPVKKSWKSADEKHQCSRTQIPLARADAVTIHCAQGRTITAGVVINIGLKDFAPGLSFVAFSRVPSITDLAVEFFDFSRLAALSNSTKLLERINEENRIRALPSSLSQPLSTASRELFQLTSLTRQFSELSPVKAVPAKRPRISNKDSPGPSVDYDERLTSQLQSSSSRVLQHRSIVGDGNCLYRAIALAVYRDQDRHNDVRLELLELMDHNRGFYVDAYEDAAEMELDLRRMARIDPVVNPRDLYGGHPQIVAAGQLYNRQINISTDRGREYSEGVGNAGAAVNLFFYEAPLEHYELME